MRRLEEVYLAARVFVATTDLKKLPAALLRLRNSIDAVTEIPLPPPPKDCA